MLEVAVSLNVEPLGVLFHALIFFAVVAVFAQCLVKPLARVRDARRQATVARQERAAAFVAEAEVLEAQHKQMMTAARQAAAAEREILRQQGMSEAAEIMHTARGKSLELFQRAQATFAGQLAAARKVLEVDTQTFVQIIAERLMERELKKNADESLGQVTPLRPAASGKSH
ncbi:MAG: hypothetical protein HY696_12670 [Deltaproteobacteria bacterium]|nr:hypothetical protein [Deltaproteobacteria bacterium]